LTGLPLSRLQFLFGCGQALLIEVHNGRLCTKGKPSEVKSSSNFMCYCNEANLDYGSVSYFKTFFHSLVSHVLIGTKNLTTKAGMCI
jgi:hypothetical protein